MTKTLCNLPFLHLKNITGICLGHNNCTEIYLIFYNGLIIFHVMTIPIYLTISILIVAFRLLPIFYYPNNCSIKYHGTHFFKY